MPTTTSPQEPTSQPHPYVLARDFKSISRLNYEHYLWHSTLNYNLHPTITSHLQLQSSSHPSPLKIADIACGTGLWLTQVAHQYPHAECHGYDISLSQTPPAQWLPENIRLREWDLYAEPEGDMLGVYDVVHVRLLFVVVRDGDPRPVIRSLKRLLKPGGWLQWDELDVGGSFVLDAAGVEDAGGGEGKSERVPGVMDEVVAALGKQGAWVKEWERNAMECGLVDGKLWRVEENRELAMAFFNNHLAKDEEMAEGRLAGTEEGRRMIERTWKLYEESKRGVVICTPKVVCTARN
ncbi:hypothetical protein ACLMJK_000359 [Lecanora helva]